MDQLKKLFEKTRQRTIDWVMGNGLMQDEVTALGNDTVTAEISALARRSGAEGAVLLQNDGTLPLAPGKPVAVFGRCQIDWFAVGYGSGGDVNPPYLINLIDGLRNADIRVDEALAETYAAWCREDEHRADHGTWGRWPMSHPEMPLEESLVQSAAERCDTALVVIGRAAGEDRENKLIPGSYYLTEEETAMLDKVTAAFAHVVLLYDIGSIMDFSFTEKYGDRISAQLILWQGGMESGNAAADVLTGRVNPCGKLSDTIARNYEDYPSSAHFGNEAYNEYWEDIFVGYRYFDTFAPEKVLYPLGYGLSYTTFTMEAQPVRETADGYAVTVRVTNTGDRAGREVVPVWCSAPQGKLGKPARVLVGYGKTAELAPGEGEDLTISFDHRTFASFDDSGITGFPYAFVLEAGDYRFTAGSAEAGTITIAKTRAVHQCESACRVAEPFRRLTAREEQGNLLPGEAWQPAEEPVLYDRILARLPKEIPPTGDRGISFADVKRGKATMDDFIAQLSDRELEALTRGEGGMGSALGTPGNAGAFGGILPSLRKKGVPPIITTDGPSGIRLRRYCSLLPNGTALACTWDDALIEALYAEVGREMRARGTDILLGPGMNIHRNPLCGRNFEYFSEDPLLTGKIAAAAIRGVQSQGVSACPKHFACNNQEVNRNQNDSRVSQRALREIYLRGYEIMVKEAAPLSIMTSYNQINGVWSHYNYDLVTTVLRRDWGYEGLVMTDWWMQKSESPEFPKIRDNAYRVRAQVDVLMPGNMNHGVKRYLSDGTLLPTLNRDGGITRGELQRTAKTVLQLAMKLGK